MIRRVVGRVAAAAYATAALVTFGFAASDYQHASWARYSACRTQAMTDGPASVDCRMPWVLDAPFVGLFAGALWPLYWSWTAADAARPL